MTETIVMWEWIEDDRERGEWLRSFELKDMKRSSMIDKRITTKRLIERGHSTLRKRGGWDYVVKYIVIMRGIHRKRCLFDELETIISVQGKVLSLFSVIIVLRRRRPDSSTKESVLGEWENSYSILRTWGSKMSLFSRGCLWNTLVCCSVIIIIVIDDCHLQSCYQLSS